MLRDGAERGQNIRIDRATPPAGCNPEVANPVIVPRGTSPIRQQVKLHDLVLRPNWTYHTSSSAFAIHREALSSMGDLQEEVAEQVEINAKYEGCLARNANRPNGFRAWTKADRDKDLDFPEAHLPLHGRKDQAAPDTTYDDWTKPPGSRCNSADLSVLLVYLGR